MGAAVSGEAELITADELGLSQVEVVAAPRAGLDGARGAAEQQALLDCLRECDFNVSEAARRLGISRVTVYRLCKKHRLALDDLR